MQQMNEAKHRNRDHKAIHTMKVNSQTSVWYRALLSGRQGHIEGTPKGNTVCCLFEGLEVLSSVLLSYILSPADTVSFMQCYLGALNIKELYLEN